jgi:hypothetical protein
MRSKVDFDNPRLWRKPPTASFKGEIEPGPIDGVGKSGCTLRHWSGITVPFLAVIGDWEFPA